MTFFEYLKNVLKYPLEGPVFNGFWNAICKIFDDLKEAVYYLRKQLIFRRFLRILTRVI